VSGRPASAPGPGPLRPYQVPVPTRVEMANGLTVVAARHGRIPQVTIHVVLDAGSIREPAELAGLAALTVESLDTGAAGRTGEALAWDLERLGVELASEPGYDAAALGATVTADRLDAALARVADVVRVPDFPAVEIDRLRAEQLADILQRRKEPRALANDMILRFVFDPAHAYGRPTTGLAACVRDLTRDHAASFHSEWVTPGRTALVIVGDIEPDAAFEAVAGRFGDWPSRPGSAADPPTAASPDVTSVHIVDRPGAVQSEIRLAHRGVERRHPDYFALRIMNSILGGAFTSRLNLNLREKHGFTYGVRSAFTFRRAPGPFLIQTAVSTEVTVRAVEEIVKELRLLHDEGALEREVADATAYLAGVVPLEFQTTGQVSARFADLVLYDLPDDHYSRLRDEFLAVTPADVARVASEYLRPDALTLCIVGDASEIGDALATTGLGAVEIHEVPE